MLWRLVHFFQRVFLCRQTLFVCINISAIKIWLDELELIECHWKEELMMLTCWYFQKFLLTKSFWFIAHQFNHKLEEGAVKISVICYVKISNDLYIQMFLKIKNFKKYFLIISHTLVFFNMCYQNNQNFKKKA